VNANGETSLSENLSHVRMGNLNTVREVNFATGVQANQTK